jgi:hypothetical protein
LHFVSFSLFPYLIPFNFLGVRFRNQKGKKIGAMTPTITLAEGVVAMMTY